MGVYSPYSNLTFNKGLKLESASSTSMFTFMLREWRTTTVKPVKKSHFIKKSWTLVVVSIGKINCPGSLIMAHSSFPFPGPRVSTNPITEQTLLLNLIMKKLDRLWALHGPGMVDFPISSQRNSKLMTKLSYLCYGGRPICCILLGSCWMRTLLFDFFLIVHLAPSLH